MDDGRGICRPLRGLRAGLKTPCGPVSAKTLRAADLLPTAGVGSAVTTRCGALRAATRAWGKVPASRQGSGAREAVGGVAQSICRVNAAFLARPPSAVALLRRTGRLQAAVAAGAAVAAVPGGGMRKGRRKNAEVVA